MESRSTRSGLRNTGPMSQPLSNNFISESRPSQIPVIGGYSTSGPDPAVKPEQPRQSLDGDTPMSGDDQAGAADTENGSEKGRMPWMKKATGVRKRPNKKMQQQRLRKHVTPKNATVALQELYPDATYTFSATPGTQGVRTAEVVVQGKKFHGVGSNKSLARAAASELALQSFVSKPKKVKNEAGHEEVVDDTPWGALASFALHKLFCDWKRGVVGTPVSLESAPTDGVGDTAGIGTRTPFVPPQRNPMDEGDSESASEGSRAKKPKMARQLPDDAAERNPVQLLHQMRPDTQFVTLAQEPGDQVYKTTATVDDQSFEATARTKKMSKREAAQKALVALYNIVYPEKKMEETDGAAEQPAK